MFVNASRLCFSLPFMGQILKSRGKKNISVIPFSLPKAVDEDSLTDPSLKSKYSSFFRLHCLLMLEFLLSFLVTQVFSLSGAPHENYQALWFERCEDRITGEQVHIYKGGYWEAKDRGSFEGCPDIF